MKNSSKVTERQKTGIIWDKPREDREQIVRRVSDALEETYGCPSLGNPHESLDDLVYIIISNKTSPTTARRTYARVREEFESWDEVIAVPTSDLRVILEPAGLATVKSEQIWAALCKIKEDFGTCDLSSLDEKPDKDVQDYLTSLPGVSDKVAKCVMVYTMNRRVLPVDSHVHRVAKRLGWTARKRADQCHEELEALVPPERRHAFHVDCIVHGREVCRPTNPLCERCCINQYCEYYRNIREL